MFQVILDCNMPRMPLKHKFLSIILILVIVSLVVVVSKKSKKKKIFFFTFLYLGKTDMVFGEKRWLFSIWNRAETRSLEKGRKSPAQSPSGFEHVPKYLFFYFRMCGLLRMFLFHQENLPEYK